MIVGAHFEGAAKLSGRHVAILWFDTGDKVLDIYGINALVVDIDESLP